MVAGSSHIDSRKADQAANAGANEQHGHEEA